MSANPAVIAAAERYIACGYAIVAVKPDKKPLGSDWRRQFSEAEILDRLKGPECAAVGFLGGSLNNGIVPLDFDSDAGEAWWQRQCEDAGIPPDDFPTVITPGKIKNGQRTPGRHRYVFDVRGTLGNAQGKLKALGIDIRGAGHAMLPPSPHPDGGTYRWLERHSLDDFDTIPPCPDFIYAAITAKAHEAEAAGPKMNGPAPSGDREIAYARAALDAKARTVAGTKDGSRNETLNVAALQMGHMIAAGWIGKAEVESALLAAAHRSGYCASDGEHAAKATIASGLKKGMAEPHKPLPDDRAQTRANGQHAGDEAQGSHTQQEPRIKLIPFDSITLATERRDLVKGLLPKEGLVVIWGPPKSSKSFWTFDVVMHVPLGWEYRGRRVQQGSVIYCAFEGQHGFRARVEAFRQRFLTEHRDPIPFFLEPITLDLVADHAELITAISMHCKPACVVLDTLNRSLRGSESKDEDMSAYIRAADAIRETFGCCVVVVHHCGIDGSRPRGHTSLSGAVDVQIAVTRDASDNITATIELAKDGPQGDVITSRLEKVEVGRDEDGAAITSCVVLPADGNTETAKPTRKLSDRQKLALGALVRIVADRGEPVPAAFALPASVMAVPLGFWREEILRCGAVARDAKNPREDFRRLKDALQARHRIAMRDELVWPL